jgi:hypothetical protein
MNRTQIIDTTAPVDLFAKNGFYQIGNAVCIHQLKAFQEATRTNLPIHWNFNDEVYQNFNWRKRLNLPITELYKIRAQQLRDKYDYLILWFSGGADSYVILRSFIDNNIHLDEVMVSWPVTFTSGKYTPNYDTNPENYLSEWDFSIKPALDTLSKINPKTRISIVDTVFNSIEDYEDTITLVDKHNYVAINRQRLFDLELKERYKTHKNIACIAGAAPPELLVLDNKWLAVQFRDTLATSGMGKSDYLPDGTPRNVEYFYWTPDFPEIVREQAHIVLDYLNINPQSRTAFPNFNLNTRQITSIDFEYKRQLIKYLVYPTWNLTTFQVKKQKDFYNKSEIYQWFFSNKESEKYLESWRAAIRSEYNLIDNKWFNNNGPTIFFSKPYFIGRLQD